jgi:CRISPR-associated protein Cas8c/Csp2
MGKFKICRIMTAIHPYIRYAQALIVTEYNLKSCDEITSQHIINEINKGLDSFRMQPIQMIEGKDKVKFDFIKIKEGDSKKGIFLAPNVISSFKESRYIWEKSHQLLDKLTRCSLEEKEDAKMSIAPTAGEYLSFSLNKKIGRGNPKIPLKELGLSAVTTLTPLKPCLQYRIEKKDMPEIFNVCIIPDLPISELKTFIQLFKRMRKTGTNKDLMFGKVIVENSGEGKNKKTFYEIRRPLIFKGNFPNPPRSSALGSIALLGTIGEFAKESQYHEQANKVLESFKSTTMYLIKYGGASTFTYNHHIVDLAKAGKLRTIVDSIYYSQLFQYGKRNRTDLKPQDRKALINEYQKFDLFTSRFLQLFNHPAFKDFLSFRAEYPNEISILFNTYFTKMEKIDTEIVLSAQALGKWLNKVAYFTAKAEVKENVPNYWEELRRIKSKVLVELESSTFSAKTGDALIAQATARAGRLSGLDAPQEAALYMVKTASGELPLENAKNLLIAFSRLAYNKEKQGTFNESDEGENEKDGEDIESTDYNDI